MMPGSAVREVRAFKPGQRLRSPAYTPWLMKTTGRNTKSWPFAATSFPAAEFAKTRCDSTSRRSFPTSHTTLIWPAHHCKKPRAKLPTVDFDCTSTRNLGRHLHHKICLQWHGNFYTRRHVDKTTARPKS